MLRLCTVCTCSHTLAALAAKYPDRWPGSQVLVVQDLASFRSLSDDPQARVICTKSVSVFLSIIPVARWMVFLIPTQAIIMPTISYETRKDGSAPYLSLPEPFTARYRLTLLKEEDLLSITKILSDDSVAGFLANVPQPYTSKDAHKWYKSQPSNSEFENLASKTDEDQRELLKTGFPFSVIREVESEDLVGYFSIRRNEWEWMGKIDPDGRKKLKGENDAKACGDESVSYSIGYYLSPEIASEGLMSVVLTTALAYAKHHMNAKHVQGICRADNIASRRVMEKNGFRYLRQVEMPIRGGGVELESVFEISLIPRTNGINCVVGIPVLTGLSCMIEVWTNSSIPI